MVEVGLLFYLVLYWASTGLFGACFVFPTERELMAKERSANMYRLSAYYISSTLCDSVEQFFYATIFYYILYFIANFQRTLSVFFLNLLEVYLVIITAHVSCDSVSYCLSYINSY
jgi:ABC-type multidrug transport system permease subunit